MEYNAYQYVHASTHYSAGQPASGKLLHSAISVSKTGICGQAMRANKTHASVAAYSDPKTRSRFYRGFADKSGPDHFMIFRKTNCFLSGPENKPVGVLDMR